MKIGNKGFMLAEALIVSVIIATVLITLFTALNNVSSAYEIRNRYYDVDSLYIAIEVNEIFRRDGVLLNDVLRAISVEEMDLETVKFSDFYSNVMDDIVNIYYTPYDVGSMKSLTSMNVNVTFSDYLDYLEGNLNFSDDYDYMIIVERREKGNIDDCYYYALKLKY